MKTENNTGLGLIKTTIERVQASELFTSALKKLANSTDAELQKFLGDVKRILKNLTLLCKIVISKVESFKVGDKFKHKAKKEIGIQMYIWDNFREWILNPMKERILSLTDETAIEKFNLNKSMQDSQIKDELGSPKPIHVTIFLPLLLHLLKQQPNGEAKKNGLLNNGYANIFHVELEDGRVVVVSVHWHSGRAEWFSAYAEWDLRADDLDYGSAWYASRSFFSPATGN